MTRLETGSQTKTVCAGLRENLRLRGNVSGLRVLGLELQIEGFGLQFQGVGFRVWGLGLEVQG